MTMDTKKTTTIDLLRLLVDRDARKRAWERSDGGYGYGYSDSSDESMVDDIVTTLAERIDGKEQGPETAKKPWEEP